MLVRDYAVGDMAQRRFDAKARTRYVNTTAGPCQGVREGIAEFGLKTGACSGQKRVCECVNLNRRSSNQGERLCIYVLSVLCMCACFVC